MARPIPSIDFASPGSTFVRYGWLAVGLTLGTLVWIGALYWSTEQSVSLQDSSAPARPPTERHSPVSGTERPVELAVSLAGIVSGKETLALLRLGDQPQRAFVAGQEVAPGVRLSAIHSDRVILKEGTTTKTLFLTTTRSVGTSPFVVPGESTNPLLDPDSLSSEEFSRDVQVTPHPEGGYYVQNVETGSFYEKLGLRQGDVVYTLDSLRLIKLEEISHLNAMTEVSRVTLEVWRNGRATVLQYNLEDGSRIEIR